MLRRFAVAFSVLALGYVGASPATAAAPVACEGYFDGKVCWVSATRPGVTTATSQVSRSNAAARQCSSGGEATPCVTSMGWWSTDRTCYVQLASPQPPPTDPVWQGHTDGAIYNCALPGAGTYRSYPFWAATAPVGPDPRVLAQQVVDSMNLRPVQIGIVPEDAPDAVGLVGLPTWLWVENPDPQSFGPVTRTASAGGITVTATARVQSVRWLMGDGGVVSCAGPGTAYEDRYGTAESPTCGYRYQKQGTYRVQAESSWSVVWSGMGQSGTIPLSLTSSTQITIGELQVLTQGRG